jgi:hypothetical protein
MPERANSFPRKIPGIVFVLLALFAVNFGSPVRAGSACIEQPGPVAAGTHWVLQPDRDKGRECWILVDAFGHETGLWGGPAVMPEAQPGAAPAPTPASATPESNTPQTSHPNPPHKPQGNVASTNKADDGVRADQKNNGKAHVAKRVSPVLLSPEESALFEEFMFEKFLRWRELQRRTGAMKPASLQ